MNVVLIGFMGSGKTAVGRRLSRRLGYGFVDTDQWIEREVGCTISQLFEAKGEPFFRGLESELATHLQKLENHVVSTGGGIVTTPGNIEHLQQAGFVVFLNADPEEIIQRLTNDTHRPKLKEGELRETVTRLLAERMPLYHRCGVAVDTRKKTAHQVAGDIIKLVAKRMQEITEETAEETPTAGSVQDA